MQAAQPAATVVAGEVRDWWRQIPMDADEGPAMKRLRERHESQHGDLSDVMRAVNHWTYTVEQFRDGVNRLREKPTTEPDVDAALEALHVSIRKHVALATNSPAEQQAEPVATVLGTTGSYPTGGFCAEVQTTRMLQAGAKLFTSPPPAAPVVPSGMALVPIEPTMDMLTALCDVKNRTSTGGRWVAKNVDLRAAWAAMLAAAAPQQNKEPGA